MRILHIIGSISPANGGTTEAVRMLIEHAPPGYSSEVVTLDEPSAPFLNTFTFPIHALGAGSWRSPHLNPWLRANRDRFDGVLVHGLWESIGLAVLQTIRGHKPYVVFPHGMLDPYFKRAFPKKHLKKQLLWLVFVHRELRSAFRVCFITAVERDLAAKTFWPSNWTPMVVGLGAEPPPHNPNTSIPAFYNLCPQVRGQRFLLFLGRLDPKKGPDLLLEAFAKTAALDPNLHLVMAGPGDASYIAQLKSSIPAALNSRIHWPGMLKGEPKWGAFAASEAFILPSHQENFGIAVVEALACAKPVLITHPINIAPDVEADGCALVEADTAQGITNILQRWIALPAGTRAAMSDQALITFATRYDIRQNAATILRLFEPAAQLHSTHPNTLAEVQ